jgi:hypothetical protein
MLLKDCEVKLNAMIRELNDKKIQEKEHLEFIERAKKKTLGYEKMIDSYQ